MNEQLYRIESHIGAWWDGTEDEDHDVPIAKFNLKMVIITAVANDYLAVFVGTKDNLRAWYRALNCDEEGLYFPDDKYKSFDEWFESNVKPYNHEVIKECNTGKYYSF